MERESLHRIRKPFREIVMGLKFSAILLCILLAGCGIDDLGYDCTNDCSGSDWSGNSVESNASFTVNYDTAVISGPIMGLVEHAWLTVQTCIGVSMGNPGLIIEYVRRSSLPQFNGGDINGYIDFDDGYIQLHDGDVFSNRTLRHEFVHWILWQLGTSSSDLESHNSPYYDLC